MGVQIHQPEHRPERRTEGRAETRGSGPRRRGPFSVSRRFALVLLGGVLALGAAGMTGCPESTFFYWPDQREFVTPQGVEDVYFQTEDGLRLHGWFMPARDWAPGDPPRPTVIHVHGNAGHVGEHTFLSSFLRDHGFHVFLFDYRSFGRSDDAGERLHRELLLLDVLAAIDHAPEIEGVDPERLAVYGFSLGSSLGIVAAAEREAVRALVGINGFASWRGVAGDAAPLIGGLLIRGGRDPQEAIANFGDRPVMIVHGGRDRTVRAHHARRLHAAAEEAGVPSVLDIIENAGHINILREDPELASRIVVFLNEAMEFRAGEENGADGPESTRGGG